LIRVIIADDHHLVRQGIRALLEKSDGIQVIGEASDGQEAVDLVRKLTPDIVVMDISMPRLDGIQATEQIRALDEPTEVVILSMHSKANIVQQVLRNGAKGYLLKSSISEELLLAIQAASRGQVYLSPGISQTLLNNLWALEEEAGAGDMAKLLTPREHEVLQLISEGHTNNDIAELLTISVKTVEKHRANLMAKLEVNDLPGLMRAAIRHGLIFVD